MRIHPPLRGGEYVFLSRTLSDAIIIGPVHRALVLLFIGSGCAALIYEVVWFQILGLVIGSSSVSLGVLLGTFMGGMGLGSLALPRVISPIRHPLRVYAVLEIGTAGIALAILYVMPLIGGVYSSWAGPGWPGIVLRSVVAAVCLLPPTVLMGATLPAIARWVEATPNGVSWMGFFYGGNIAGAVAGSMLAGFYLLRFYDVTVATFVGVVINVAVAAAGFLIARSAPYKQSGSAATFPSIDDARRIPARTWPVYVTIALSGMTALAAEVIWTRHLSLLFGATVYTFSLILAVFLMGLGIGSCAGAAIARRLDSARWVLGLCQFLLCVTIAWAAWTVTESLPYWPVDPSITRNPWLNFQLDLFRSIWAVLPAACLWGASFPLALAAVASRGEDPGRLVGGVLAANTIGAIAGALGASLIFVSWMGTGHVQQLLIVISAIAGTLMWGRRHLVVMAVAVFCALLLAWSVPRVSGEFIAFGRFLPSLTGTAEVVYAGEGLTASVAVTRDPNGMLSYHNAGKIQASSYPQDMRLQRMLGHLTTLLPETPRSFLVIGCGAGVTAGAVSINPEAERIVIAEIEPLVPEVAARYFGEQNYDVVRNPKVTVHIDDGRHYLLTTGEKFDGITSDPLDPWVKGAAALYTREFFELAKAHLKPGGVVTVFVQLYESTEEAIKSEVATFFEVFPDGAIFANTLGTLGYDLVLLGQAEPAPINVDRIEERLRSPQYARAAQSLREVNIASALDLLGTYAGQRSDLASWLKDAAINRDANMRLQYLAGRGLNLFLSDVIYDRMISSGLRFPENLFAGSPRLIAVLREDIEARQGR
ncbi:MAG: SAM-dependent methyltransferase [Bryobacterales bacterium]|nr:SAM-dependent methyltransferase [Bryobacterales bacterium]